MASSRRSTSLGVARRRRPAARAAPLDTRKATLALLLKQARPDLPLNDHIEADGPTVFAHACKMDLEGHRVEAEGLALSVGALARLDKIRVVPR